MQPWECPRCGAMNAGWVARCGCTPGAAKLPGKTLGEAISERYPGWRFSPRPDNRPWWVRKLDADRQAMVDQHRETLETSFIKTMDLSRSDEFLDKIDLTVRFLVDPDGKITDLDAPNR